MSESKWRIESIKKIGTQKFWTVTAFVTQCPGFKLWLPTQWFDRGSMTALMMPCGQLSTCTWSLFSDLDAELQACVRCSEFSLAQPGTACLVESVVVYGGTAASCQDMPLAEGYCSCTQGTLRIFWCKFGRSCHPISFSCTQCALSVCQQLYHASCPLSDLLYLVFRIAKSFLHRQIERQMDR